MASTSKGTTSPDSESKDVKIKVENDQPASIPVKSAKRKLDEDHAPGNEEKKIKTIKVEDDNNKKYEIKEEKKEEIKKAEKTETQIKIEVKEENTSPLDFSDLYRVTAMRLKLLTPSNFTQIGQFPLRRKCFRLSYINGEIWAPSEVGVIDIYSTEGVYLRKLEPISANSPGIMYNAVYPLSKDHLLISSNKGLIKTDYEGKWVSTILKGEYLDVFVTETSIGIIQNLPVGFFNKIRFVLILDRANLTLKKKFKVDDDSRYLLISNSEIIIGATGNFHDCMIKYDLEGNEKQKFGQNRMSYIPGNFRISRLCMVDYEGSLLVTDKHQRRLQVLDADGHWVIPQSYVESPLDVIVIPDDIMLVISDASKVLKFKVNV